MKKLNITWVSASMIFIFLLFITNSFANVPQVKNSQGAKYLQVKDNQWLIRIRRVVDPAYTMISKEDYEKALREAERTAKLKLGIEIRFVDVGEQNVDEFFKPFVDDHNNCFYQLWDYKLDDYRRSLVEFINSQKLSLGLLKKYFNEDEQKNLQTQKDFVEKVVHEYEDTLNFLKEEKISGIPIIRKENCYANSRECWGQVYQYVKGADFILTNVPILADSPGAFIPLLRGGFVEGFGTFMTTFPIYGYVNTPFFEKRRGEITDKMKPLILGQELMVNLQFIIALPSFISIDDKNAGCLSYRGPKFKLNFVEQYKAISNTKACDYEVKRAQYVLNLHKIKSLLRQKKFMQAEKQLTVLLNKNAKDEQFLLFMLLCKIKLQKQKDVDAILKKLSEDQTYKEYGGGVNDKLFKETGLDYMSLYHTIDDLFTNEEKQRIKETLTELRKKNK